MYQALSAVITLLITIKFCHCHMQPVKLLSTLWFKFINVMTTSLPPSPNLQKHLNGKLKLSHLKWTKIKHPYAVYLYLQLWSNFLTTKIIIDP